MPNLPVNSAQTVSIDATGEVATYEISGTHPPAQTIGLNIDADEAIDLSVDVGVDDRSTGAITWFDDAVTYTGTATVRDAWVQAEEWLRIRVTTAASANSEATIYLARGEER